MNELSCPKCKVGTVQRSTVYIENKWYEAFGCNKCHDGHWEPVIDMKTYTISSDGIVNLALRSKETADAFAKDISEMSDEEVKENTKKYFLDRQADMKYAIDTGTAYTITAEDYRQSYLLEKAERERLIKKLEAVQDKLKEFLKDLETSPQQVSFEKEVLVKFISEMIEESK
jgi:hypothetical protein